MLAKKLTFDPDMLLTFLKMLEYRELKITQNRIFNFVKKMVFEGDMTETCFFQFLE
jgi:hypothetical protein